MGTDIAVFGNHNINFSCGDYFKITDEIVKKLNDAPQIECISEIKEQIRGYYDWEGYNHDDVRQRQHDKIDN